MKRGKKRISVTEKLGMETRGEAYWDNWAERRAAIKRENDANATSHCVCTQPCAKWPACKPRVVME